MFWFLEHPHAVQKCFIWVGDDKFLVCFKNGCFFFTCCQSLAPRLLCTWPTCTAFNFQWIRIIKEASFQNVAFKEDVLCIRRRVWTPVTTSIQNQGHRFHSSDRHATADQELTGHSGTWRNVHVVEWHLRAQERPTCALFIRKQ